LRKFTAIIIFCLAVAVVLLTIEVVALKHSESLPKFTSSYQAVLLDDGEVFYGKLSRLGTDYPEMTQVYYVVRTTDPQTKQPKNVLVKRGKEWHGPTETYFNARHIIMIEPVSPDSEVAHLITQAESQGKK
jgi:hypothetical protein